ncbi:MAG: hypothetical protein ACE5MM_09725 [Nitrospiraceae bacterium]
MKVGASHTLYDSDPFTRSRTRDTRPHPVMEMHLLDPTGSIWQRGNIYLRLFPDELRYCLGDRLLRMYDATLPQNVRAQARSELQQLRRSVRRYFRYTARPPGRPPKLTAKQREDMSAEQDRLRNFIRQIAGEHSPSHKTLDRLVRDPEFLAQLFQAFPCLADAKRMAWAQFLRASTHLPLSERCLHYLAYRYGVSVDTIRSAIWSL